MSENNHFTGESERLQRFLDEFNLSYVPGIDLSLAPYQVLHYSDSIQVPIQDCSISHRVHLGIGASIELFLNASPKPSSLTHSNELIFYSPDFGSYQRITTISTQDGFEIYTPALWGVNYGYHFNRSSLLDYTLSFFKY